MDKNIKKIRIFLFSCLFLGLGWIIFLGVAPGGEITYSCDFARSSKFIGRLMPKERVLPPQNGSQKIIGDPVYFSLYTTRTFDKAEISFEYKNNMLSDKTGIIEAGVLADKDVWRYELEPIENALIERLRMVWDDLEDGGMLLLQKEKKYESIADFMNNPPSREKIAVYNCGLKSDFVLPEYKKSGERISLLPACLSGSWEFFTYIKEEDLDFEFVFGLPGASEGASGAKIFVFYGDALIHQQDIADGNDNANERNDNGEKTLRLMLKNLPEGPYKIELKTENDIITKDIVSSQSKMSFFNSLSLCDDGRKDIALFTNTRALQAKTIFPSKLQSIDLPGGVLVVNDTYKQYEGSVERPSSSPEFFPLNIKKDGLTLSGDGVFSFSPQAFFDPRIKKIDNNFDIKGNNIEFVLADYKSPEENALDKRQTVEFDLKKAYREKGKYSFIISARGLLPDDGLGDYLELNNISIKLSGTSLMEKIKKIISAK